MSKIKAMFKAISNTPATSEREAEVVAPTIKTPTIKVTTPEEGNMKNASDVLMSTEKYQEGKIISGLINRVVKGEPAEWDLVPVVGTCIMVVKAGVYVPEESASEWAEAHIKGLGIKIGADIVTPTLCTRTLDRLMEEDLLDSEGVPTEKMADIMRAKQTYVPSTQWNDLIEYRKGDGSYGLARITKLGDLPKAINVLEQSPFSIVGDVLEVINTFMRDSYSSDLDIDGLVKDQLWNLRGIQDLYRELGEEAMYQNWKADKVGRQYPLSWHSPNLQGGDIAKACFGWAKDRVNMDYDPAATKELIIKELKDISKMSGDTLKMTINTCITDPAAWLKSQIIAVDGPKDALGISVKVSANTIKKPFTFMAWCLSLRDLSLYMAGQGEKPVIRLPFGMDCNCSGAQIVALICKNIEMLERTGFSEQAVRDAYENLADILGLNGFKGFTRPTTKGPFTRVQYGQGASAHSQFSADMEDIFDLVHPDHAPMDLEKKKKMDFKAFEARSEHFHECILTSFGKQTRTFMDNVAESIQVTRGEYVDTKVDKDIEFFQADGFQVHMKERVSYDILGNEIKRDSIPDLKYQFDGVQNVLESFKVKSNEKDFGRMSRKGVVTLTHSTDALMCRTIVRNLWNLGVRDVFTVHDCIRVQAADMPKLREAIDQMYLELFATETAVDNPMFPYGQDIMLNFYQGVARASKTGELTKKTHSQFFGKSKIRRLTEVKGKGINLKDVIGKTDKYWS